MFTRCQMPNEYRGAKGEGIHIFCCSSKHFPTLYQLGTLCLSFTWSLEITTTHIIFCCNYELCVSANRLWWINSGTNNVSFTHSLIHNKPLRKHQQTALGNIACLFYFITRSFTTLCRSLYGACILFSTLH